MLQDPVFSAFHFVPDFLVLLAAAAGAIATVTGRGAPTGRVRRAVFGAGFALLATDATLSGALVVLEGSAVLTGLRTASYVLFLAAFVSPRRSHSLVRTGAGATFTTVPALSEILYSRVTTAVAALLAAAVLWLHGRARIFKAGGFSSRRFCIGLALMAASEIALSRKGAPAWWAAHLLRCAGAVVWILVFYSGTRPSIGLRFAAAVIMPLLSVILVLGFLTGDRLSSTLSSNALARAESEASGQVEALEELKAKSLERAHILAGLESVRRAVSSRDPSLRALASGLRDPGVGLFEDLSLVAFVDPRGSVIASSGLDMGEAEALASTRLVAETLGPSQKASSLEELPNSELIIGAAEVVRSATPPGVAAGAVIVGSRLDREFLIGLRTPAPVHDIVLIQKGRVRHVRSGGLFPGLDSDRLDDLAGSTTERRVILKSHGERFFLGSAPLVTEDGRVRASLAFVVSSAIVVEGQRQHVRTLFLALLAAALSAFAIAWVVGLTFTRPIGRLIEVAEKVREGDLRARADINADDELGRLGRAFDSMTASLGMMTGDLRTVLEEEFRLRSRMEAILQSMQDPLIAVDSEGRIATFNPAAETLTGIEAGHALGQPAEKLLSLQDAEGRPIEISVESSNASISKAFFSVEGQRVPVSIALARLADPDGLAVGAVAIIRDQTRAHQFERMKTEFLANVSHELRSPLTPIKGFASIMLRRDVPRAQALDFLQGILQSVTRLERTVDLLVDYSALEAGRLELEISEVEMAALVADIVGVWEKKSPSHRFISRGVARSPQVHGDERLLRKCLEEMIDNAVKFSPQGGTVTIRAELVDDPSLEGGYWFRISISDEGIGIPANRFDAIFEDFQQLDGSNNRSFGGLGLGLAFVHRIVRAHGGYLQTSSRPDGGSSFAMVLPLKSGAAAQTLAHDETAVTGAG